MKFNFKDGAKAEIGTDDPWYALTLGGYLQPETVLADPDQIANLQKSIVSVRAFIDKCYENEVIEDA